MKKNFFKYAVMLFVAFVGMVAATSCSKDSEESAELVGTWQIVDDENQYITFANSNTVFYYKFKSEIRSVAKSSYSYNGSTLKVTNGFDGESMEVAASVSGNTLTMSAEGHTMKAHKVESPATVEQLEKAWQNYIHQ